MLFVKEIKLYLVKSLLTKIQNILIYIGYAAGMILLLENMAKILRTGTETGIRILLFATFFWFMSLLSRKFVFDNHLQKMTFSQKIRLELMYYVFSHTFVMVFVTSILKYTPVGYHYTNSPLPQYSYLLNYLSNQFIFLVLVHFTSVCLFIWFLMTSSNLIYKYAIQREAHVPGNRGRLHFIQSAVFAIMLTISLGLLNIPIVWQSVNILNASASKYLSLNFQWVVDYVIGSPIVYYAYTSMRGSELVEHFSLYRKIV
jgi:hypothetical protein